MSDTKAHHGFPFQTRLTPFAFIDGAWWIGLVLILASYFMSCFLSWVHPLFCVLALWCVCVFSSGCFTALVAMWHFIFSATIRLCQDKTCQICYDVIDQNTANSYSVHTLATLDRTVLQVIRYLTSSGSSKKDIVTSCLEVASVKPLTQWSSPENRFPTFPHHHP